jgi:hypothetical protein
MSSTRTAAAVFEQNFLDIRCKLIELAAALDRIERADSADEVDADPRIEQIQEAIEVLGSRGFDRAERLQLIFSDQYDPNWNK